MIKHLSSTRTYDNSQIPVSRFRTSIPCLDGPLCATSVSLCISAVRVELLKEMPHALQRRGGNRGCAKKQLLIFLRTEIDAQIDLSLMRPKLASNVKEVALGYG